MASYLSTLSPEAAVAACMLLGILGVSLIFALGSLAELVRFHRHDLRRFGDQAADARIAGEGW